MKAAAVRWHPQKISNLLSALDVGFFPKNSYFTLFYPLKQFSNEKYFYKNLTFNILLNPGIFSNSGVFAYPISKNLEGEFVIYPGQYLENIVNFKQSGFHFLFIMKGFCKQGSEIQ